MILNKEVYRGLVVTENWNAEKQSEYCTVYNPFTKQHTHISAPFNAAKSIVDCYHAKNKSRYGLAIRNKAMRLGGFYVHY